jgi:hypothetical protein
MGLEITAYENVSWLREPNEDDEDGVPPPFARLWVSGDFTERADGLRTGVYETWGETVDFRAGSYSGYNAWRSWLARLVGTTDQEVWDNPVAGPFVELIWFSDCEGVIGPVTSRKLANDFQAWDERAKVFKDEDRGYYGLYQLWAQAFELAADTGCVDFG